MGFNLENLLLLFFVFCLIGWIIELFYRSYKAKKITNPGFLSGPYVPIYGAGGIIAYFSVVYSGTLSKPGALLFFLFLVGVVEYFTGFFFEKFFKVRLWDYSDRRLNLGGHVCLRFMVNWLFLGLFFKYFLYSHFDQLARNITINSTHIFFLGLIYGVFLVDLVQSFNLAYKIRTSINQFGENHLARRVFALKNLYRDVSSELNSKMNLSEKTLGLKESGLYVVNYFRLTRNIKDELQKVVDKRLQKLKEEIQTD